MADGFFSTIRKSIAGDPIAKAAVPTATLGSSNGGVLDLAGFIYSDDRSELNLTGQRRWQVYNDNVRDLAIVSAGVRLFLNMLSNAVWTVNPPDGLDEGQQAQAQEIADLAYDIIFDMTSSWATVVRKTATFRLMGFAILEWTAKKRDDGAIGFLDIESRPQRTITKWKADPSGTIESVVQTLARGGTIEIPRSKIVYAVDDSLTESPEGIGLYRHIAATGDRLRKFMELEQVGFETDLRGIPIARAPLGELQKEVDAAGDPGTAAYNKAAQKRRGRLQPLLDFIKNHVRNKQTGVTLPSDVFNGTTGNTDAVSPSQTRKWDISLLNGDSTSFEAMAKAIQRLNQEIARTLGVEHLMLGSDGSGSLALAQSKIGTFYMNVTSTLLDLVEVFDRDVIGPLAVMNNWPPELVPQMGVNEISDRDVSEIATALWNLSQAGAPLMPGDPAIDEVRDMLGLSRAPKEAADLDASLAPNRNDPVDDKSLDDNPEDQGMAKMMRSRRKRVKPRRKR